jgi:arginine N-succinyltransferase
MGVPHPSGRAAMKMLEREGFHHDCYIDIFDGGPTMVAATDQIRTDPRIARADGRRGRDEGERPEHDARRRAARRLRRLLRRGRSRRTEAPRSTARTAEMLGLEAGDTFLAMSR